MTRAFDAVNRRFVELTAADSDRACDEHAHCPACGEVTVYEAGRLVCGDCSTGALAEPKSWEPAVQR